MSWAPAQPGAHRGPLGHGVPGGPPTPTPGDWVPRGPAALTVVAPVAGLLLAAVGRHAVDLHPHEGVHDGAALLLVQLGQLLGRDDLRARGCGGLAARRGRWPRGKGQGRRMAGSGGRGRCPPGDGQHLDGHRDGVTQEQGRGRFSERCKDRTSVPRREVGGTWLGLGLVSPIRGAGGTWLGVGLALVSPSGDAGGTHAGRRGGPSP